MAKRWRRHGAVQFGVIEAVELELEKQDVAGERGYALLRVAIEFRDFPDCWCRKRKAATHTP